MTKPISVRRDDAARGSSLLDALVGVVLVAIALLAVATILAPALRALSAFETESRARGRTMVEAFE